MKKIAILFSLLGFIFLSSCEYDFVEPKKAVPPPPPDTTRVYSFKNDVLPNFANRSCTGCHASAAPILTSNVYNNIISVAAKYRTGTLINKDKPAESVMYLQVKNHLPAVGAQVFTDEESNNLLQWIMAGAKDN